MLANGIWPASVWLAHPQVNYQHYANQMPIGSVLHRAAYIFEPVVLT